MENGVDLTIEMAGLDALDEVVLVEIIGDFAIDQVLELVGLGQVVDRNDVGNTPRSLSALTILEPIKPAAPVTTMYMNFPLQSCGEFFAGDNGRAQFADDDTGRNVGGADRFGPVGTRPA
jgi:hypothetical protein